MSDLLLQTKLFKPALRPSLINRSHLTDRLNGGLNQAAGSFAARLMVISAPAGFGKTTLVASWVSTLSAVKTAWLSLDENDNDPVRFLVYLIAALQTADPRLGETAVSLLQAPQPPPAETVLTLLINDLSQYTHPIILVLDDYHVIITPAIHQAMAFLLDHQPPGLHLLLTTRSDPPLPLSRLRARDQVVEIRANDLRLTIEEAGQFLNQVMGLKLSQESLATLEERTEGWIAGLQLAALSMQGQSDLSTFIDAFSGSHRFILDYLTDEVLERRPKGTRQFLLQTSILDRLCAPLCDAVTGRSGSQQILELLEQANLFLIPLDENRHWYRYHHLFADILQQRFQQEQPDLVADLYTRASIWYEQNNLLTDAVNYAFLAHAYERAAVVIERGGHNWLEKGMVNPLKSWLEALPTEVLRKRPQLNLLYAYALAYTGNPVGFHSRLAEIEEIVRGPNILPVGERNDILAEVAALQARAAFNQNQSLNIGELRAAFATISEDNNRVRGVLALAIGQAERLAGNLKEAAEFFTLAANLAQKRGDRLQAIYTTGFLADLQETQGLLRQAALSYQESLKMATMADGKLFTAAATACIGLGRVYYEWNDLENAGQYLQQALKLGRQSGIEAAELYAAMQLAMVLEGQGSGKEADALVQRAAEIAQKWHSAQIINRVSAVKAHLALVRGLWQEAAKWAQSNSMTINDDIAETSLAEYCTLARLLIAQTRLDEAFLLLDRLLPLAQRAGLLRAVIEILGMRALAWHARKSSSEAIAAIERALSAGEPEGFCRVFLDMGEPMAGLLQQARRQGLFLDYVNKLLATFQVVESKQSGAELLPEPLSEREEEVLRAMANGASNKEIAGQLFIAVTTVKKHVGNILVKLDAANRSQAVARARDLGILS